MSNKSEGKSCDNINTNLKFKLNKNVKQQEFEFSINFYESIIPNESKEEYGYNSDINLYRNKIDNIHDEIWKKIRWFINKYDFTVNGNIINRAFYKYWEMIHEFEIFKEYNLENDIILHCAEAPGGFIQGSNTYLNLNSNSTLNVNSNSTVPENDDNGFTVVKRKKNKKINKTDVNYRLYTMSLNKNIDRFKRYNLPSYNKHVINKHVCILNGNDNTGDINNLENIQYIDENVKLPFYLITCDGGFDEGYNNFNNKEQLHHQLILNEIYCSIKLQKENGHFILKMFDIFTDTSIHLLYLLNLCYKEVYIYKPLTSRPTNSEKYIICKYFCCEDDFRKLCLENLEKLSKMFNRNKVTYKSFYVFKEIPKEFIENIKNINTEIVGRQCFYLKNAIDLCNDSFIDQYTKEYTKSMNERKILFENWKKNYNLDKYMI